MTHMYGVRGSFVLLRPKKKVKLPTQSAENQICMGTWALEILEMYSLENKKAQDYRTFSPSEPATELLGYKTNSTRNLLERQKNILSQKFSILSKMTIIHPRTLSFWLCRSSLAPPILVCWRQTMACWNCDTKGVFFWSSSRRQGGLHK